MSFLFPKELVDTILFPSPKSTYDHDGLPDRLLWLPRSLHEADAGAEDAVPCMLMTSPSARFVILYLHSNAEDLGRCRIFCDILRTQFQVHVLAVEYPGYGLCPGKATESTVVENATLALRFLRDVLKWSLDEVLVLGRSIGTGPAMYIGSQYKVAGVILICPFLSVRELFRQFVGRVADAIQERFPNSERMKDVASPLLIVHGKLDTVVPWTHGEALFEGCRARKKLVTPPTMHHNSNLFQDPSFFVLPMLHFFSLPDYTFDDLVVPEWCYTAPAISLGMQRLGSNQAPRVNRFSAAAARYQDSASGGALAFASKGGSDRCPSERPSEPSVAAEVPTKPPAIRAAAAAAVIAMQHQQHHQQQQQQDQQDQQEQQLQQQQQQQQQLDQQQQQGQLQGGPLAVPQERIADARGAIPRSAFSALSSTKRMVVDEDCPSQTSDDESAVESLAQDRLAAFLKKHLDEFGDLQTVMGRVTCAPEAEEEVDMQAAITMESSTCTSREASSGEDDLALPPSDVGFFKVPQTRKGGPGRIAQLRSTGAGRALGMPLCDGLLTACGTPPCTLNDYDEEPPWWRFGLGQHEAELKSCVGRSRFLAEAMRSL